MILDGGFAAVADCGGAGADGDFPAALVSSVRFDMTLEDAFDDGEAAIEGDVDRRFLLGLLARIQAVVSGPKIRTSARCLRLSAGGSTNRVPHG